MTRGAERRGGFVLALVVFMLFAISVAGVTGYIVVSSEFELSKYSGQGSEALTVARAGLERFIAEQIGVVDDSTSYALGGGVAVVTTRRIFTPDSSSTMYYVRSEGVVEDILSPGASARRVVGAYATRHRSPLVPRAAVSIGADRIDVRDGGEAHGQNYSSPGDCIVGNAPGITGAIAAVTVTEDDSDDVQGSPQIETWPAGWSAVHDSAGLRWDVLSDPNFPVDFENTLPDFGSIPPDSFPLIRYTGWVAAGWTGRGALIVDGVFDPDPGFEWDGIVLAKEVDDIIQGEIDGILVGGLEGPNPYATVELRTDVNYHSCAVHGANETLSYLELLPNTIYELY